MGVTVNASECLFRNITFPLVVPLSQIAISKSDEFKQVKQQYLPPLRKLASNLCGKFQHNCLTIVSNFTVTK